jgi:hypothetical protein
MKWLAAARTRHGPPDLESRRIASAVSSCTCIKTSADRTSPNQMRTRGAVARLVHAGA